MHTVKWHKTWLGGVLHEWHGTAAVWLLTLSGVPEFGLRLHRVPDSQTDLHCHHTCCMHLMMWCCLLSHTQNCYVTITICTISGLPVSCCCMCGATGVLLSVYPIILVKQLKEIVLIHVFCTLCLFNFTLAMAFLLTISAQQIMIKPLINYCYVTQDASTQIIS